MRSFPGKARSMRVANSTEVTMGKLGMPERDRIQRETWTLKTRGSSRKRQSAEVS